MSKARGNKDDRYIAGVLRAARKIRLDDLHRCPCPTLVELVDAVGREAAGTPEEFDAEILTHAHKCPECSERLKASALVRDGAARAVADAIAAADRPPTPR